MDLSVITNWAQLGLLAAGTVAAIVLAVGQLFKTMSNSYGTIISSLQAHISVLQTQNADQEKRMGMMNAETAAMRHQLAQSDKDCDDKINSLQHVTAGLSARVLEVEQKTS